MATKFIYDVYNSKCPTRLALDRIASKWTVLVLVLLETGSKRFSGLKRSIDGISQKVLTQTLRELERDGLITRTIYPVVPPHVEYELTALGRTLSSPISSIKYWAEAHIEKVLSAQQVYDRRTSLVDLPREVSPTARQKDRFVKVG